MQFQQKLNIMNLTKVAVFVNFCSPGLLYHVMFSAVILSTTCRVSSIVFLSYSRCHHIFSNCCFVLWEWKSFMCCIDVGNHYLAISLSFCHSIGKPCFSWKDDLLSSLSLTVRVCVHQEPKSCHCYFQRRMHCSMFPVNMWHILNNIVTFSSYLLPHPFY